MTSLEGSGHVGLLPGVFTGPCTEFFRAALARAVGARAPVYRFMFCNLFAVGFPPRPYALSAYLSPLAEEAPGAPWMIAGVSADIRP
jgi:hypothetical protein